MIFLPFCPGTNVFTNSEAFSYPTFDDLYDFLLTLDPQMRKNFGNPEIFGLSLEGGGNLSLEGGVAITPYSDIFSESISITQDSSNHY